MNRRRIVNWTGPLEVQKAVQTGHVNRKGNSLRAGEKEDIKEHRTFGPTLLRPHYQPGQVNGRTEQDLTRKETVRELLNQTWWAGEKYTQEDHNCALFAWGWSLSAEGGAWMTRRRPTTPLSSTTWPSASSSSRYGLCYLVSGFLSAIHGLCFLDFGFSFQSLVSISLASVTFLLS